MDLVVFLLSLVLLGLTLVVMRVAERR